jgi:hypothetical protein
MHPQTARQCSKQPGPVTGSSSATSQPTDDEGGSSTDHGEAAAQLLAQDHAQQGSKGASQEQGAGEELQDLVVVLQCARGLGRNHNIMTAGLGRKRDETQGRWRERFTWRV